MSEMSIKVFFMVTILLIVIVALACHRQLTLVVLTQGFNACYERKGCCYDYYYHYCRHYRIIAACRYRRSCTVCYRNLLTDLTL